MTAPVDDPTPVDDPKDDPATKDDPKDEPDDWYEALPPRAKALITKLRNEAAGSRVKAKTTEEQLNAQLRKVAEALGLANDDADPDKLLRELEEVRDQARTRAIDLSVYQQAKLAGADPDAVLDSRAFQNSVKDLDPEAEGFKATILTKIKEAVQANAKLKAEAPAKKAAGASGTANGGGPGDGGPKKPTSLSEAIAAKYAR